MKLYLVTHTIETYVAAENEQEAEWIAAEAVWESADFHDCEAMEVRHDDRIADGWDASSLVWHGGKDDVSIADVWPEKPAPPAQGLQLSLIGGRL